jgi:hypothetical protein
MISKGSLQSGGWRIGADTSAFFNLQNDSILAASVRPSQVVVGVSNHKDKGELSVLIRFTNLDNQTSVWN